jgi:hypothetical protein
MNLLVNCDVADGTSWVLGLLIDSIIPWSVPFQLVLQPWKSWPTLTVPRRGDCFVLLVPYVAL